MRCRTFARPYKNCHILKFILDYEICFSGKNVNIKIFF